MFQAEFWVAVAFVILGVAVVLESFSLRTAVKEAGPERRGRSWVDYVRRSKSPELPVVLLEDFGALIAGHGGILDRIDSLCFAAPVFFHLVRYFFGE